MGSRLTLVQSIARTLFVVAVLIVTASAAISWLTWRGFFQQREQLQAARQVSNTANGLLSSLKDAESGQRGFLITGEDAYLEPYRQALNEIPGEFEILARLEARWSPEQRGRIEQLRTLVNARLGDLKQSVDVRRGSGFDVAPPALRSDRGKALMDKIRGACAAIVADSDARLNRQTAAVTSAANILNLISTAGGLSLLLILILAAISINRAASERERLIANLQKSRELLATFVRHVPASVAMLDRNMIYVEVSDRSCAEFGSDRERMLGRSHYEVFPAVPERWKEVHRRCLNGEMLRAEEDFLDNADGTRTWLRWEVRPWGMKDGLPEGVLIFSEDITKRKEIEERLRRERDRLDKIIATVPGAICAFRLRPDGSVSLPYSTPWFQRMLPELPDLSEDARPLFEMMHPDDVDRVRENIEVSARALTPYHGAYRVVTPGRGDIWVQVHSVPEREPDGSVYWYGFVMDVTERERMQQALRERETMVSALFETASQGILAVAPDGVIRLANRTAEEIFGYGQGDLLGLRVEMLLPAHLRERHESHRQTFSSAPKNRPMGVGLDLQGHRRDGSEFPVEVSLSHIETPQGPLTVGFLTDITVRKAAELALRKSERRLHKLAGKLMEAQEEERRRVSRELHDQICQQLASLALGIGEIAARDTAATVLYAALKELQGRAVRASEEARHLAYELHPSVLDDLGLVAALQVLCDDSAERERVMVEFTHGSLPHTLPREIAACLYRVAAECMQNICRHAGAQHVRVALAHDEGRLGLTIEDDGVGFDLAAVRGRGSLGLMTMEERARVIKGELRIDTAPGRGARIALSVPVDIT